MRFESHSFSPNLSVKTWPAIAVLTLTLAGCATAGLTHEQRRELETRIINGELEEVFHSARSVLQDHGYIIGHSEMASGTLTGESVAERGGFLSLGPQRKKKVTVSLEKWAPQQVRVRITLLQLKRTATTTTVFGGSISIQSAQEWDEKLITDAKVYQLLFDQIKREVFRRESLKEK